jgi:hypothetical protein
VRLHTARSTLLALAACLAAQGAAAQHLPSSSVKADPTVGSADEAARIASLDPVAEVKRALSRGDLRLLAVCGYVCVPPGVELDEESGTKPMPGRILPDTSDARATAALARLNAASYRYAERYNREMARALGGKPRPAKTVHG